jgi:hypothetical protein
MTEQVPVVTPPVVAPTVPVVENVQNVVNPDISKLVSQADEYRTKAEAAVAKLEVLQNQQYDTLVADMKSLGFNDPSAIVRGLPTEQKISVLSKMKENIVVNKPLAANTPATPQPTEGDKIGSALREVQDELGISDEMMAKIQKKR